MDGDDRGTRRICAMMPQICLLKSETASSGSYRTAWPKTSLSPIPATTVGLPEPFSRIIRSKFVEATRRVHRRSVTANFHGPNSSGS